MTGIFNGLQILISSLRSVIEFIKSAWTFFTHIVSTIGQLILLLVNVFNSATTIILTLPSWLLAFGTLTIGICVLYLIVGREHGN